MYLNDKKTEEKYFKKRNTNTKKESSDIQDNYLA